MNKRISILITTLFLVSFSSIFGQTITVIPSTLDFGDVVVNTTSSEKSYAVSGSNLTDNISITAPSGYEISTISGSGFGSSITLTQSSGTVNNTTIYVRFVPTAVQSYSGNITNISSGAETKNVSLSGTGVSAVLNIDESDQNVDNGSGSITPLSITSNISWTISSNAPWLTITSATSGSGNGTITATFTANPTTGQRTGIITLTGGGITRNVNVIQAAGSAVLSIDESDQNVGNGSGSITPLSITSNISWTISSNAPWLTITSATSGSGNGTITATFTANPTTGQRTGIITLTGGGITRNVNVIQAAGSAVLSIDESDQNVGNGSGSITPLSITSNISWTISSNAPWLTITSATSGSGNGTITATFTANPTTGQRTGIITLTGGGITRNVNVIQAAGSAVLSIDESDQNVGNGSGSITPLSITSNISWTISSNAPWLTITSATSGSGNGTITATFTANPTTGQRTGIITLTGGGITRNVNVIQAAGSAVLSIDESDQNVGNGSGSITPLSITSNISWTISSNAPWLTITSATSGSGNGTITATFTANPTTGQRTGIITLTGGGITRNVNVIQAAGSAVLSIDESDQNVGNGSGSITPLSITSNISWTISSNAPWLTITSATSGSGNGTITATFTANPTTGQRTGIITLTGGGITRNVNVIQAAGSAVLSIDESDQNVGNGSGSITPLSITSNISWTISSNAPWLTITSATSGSGNGTITATFTANPTTGQRTGIITLTGGGITRNVNVIQAAGSAVLSIDESDQNVGNGSGSITPLSITSNISWTISSNAPWLTITSATSGSGNGTITATFTANPTTGQRTGIITLTGSGITRNVNVIQAAGSAVLSIDESDQNVGNGSGSITPLSITSNISWTISSNTPWLTITSATSGSGNGTITATFTANPTTGQRTGIITLTGSGITRNVNVIQAAGDYLTLNKTSETVGNGSGSFTFDISSNVTWTSIDNATWLSLSSSGGSGDASITATYTANGTTTARSGIITVSDGTITRTINVSQAGKYIISALSAPIGSGTITGTGSYFDGDEVSLTAVPNTGYTFNNWTENGTVVSSSINYIFTASSSRSLIANFSLNSYNITALVVPIGSGTVTGTGNYSHGEDVTLTAIPNTGYSFVNWKEGSTVLSTSPTLTFEATGGRSLSANFRLNELTVTPTNQNVLNTAGSTTFEITANVSWSVNENVTWLSVTPSSGSGNSQITVNYGANPTTNQRVGTIAISGGDLTRSLTVTQAGKYTISALSAPGGSGTITGTGSYFDGDEVSLTAVPNTGYTFNNWTENGTVVSSSINYIFTASSSRNLVANFILNQLTVSPNNQNVLNTAGSINFTVTSNVSWNASKKAIDTWITSVTPSGSNNGTVTVNYAANTTTSSRSATITITGGGISRDITVTQAGKYIVSAIIDPIGSGTLTGIGNYSHGEDVTLTATPNNGYSFLNWKEGSTVISTNPTLTFEATGSRSLSANFILNELTVTPTNQNVLNTAGSTTFDITSNVSWSVNENVTWLSVIPSSGSGNSQITVNYGAIPTTNQRVGTIAISGGDLTRNVTVTQAGKYTISALSAPGGSGTITGTGSYFDGDEVSLTAVPNTGYTFSNWTENGTVVSSSINYIFTASSSRSLIANFSLNSYNITALVVPIGSGTVTGTGNYSHGEDVTLTAIPNTGYSFVNWKEGSTVLSTSPTLTFEATGGRSLSANFRLNELTVTPTNQNVLNTAGSTTFEITANVSWSVNENVTWLSVTPSSGSGNSQITVNYGANPTTNQRVGTIAISGGDLTRSLTVTQAGKYTISALSAPGGSGTITGTGSYFDGDEVSLTAVPTTGYTFNNWTENGAVVSSNINYIFTASSSRSLVANFSLNSYSVSTVVAPIGTGSVSGGGTYSHGSTAILEATPEVGYSFTSWSGDVISTANPLNFIVDSEKIITANFTLNKYQIVTLSSPFQGGTTSGGGTFDHGATVKLVATPATGYNFTSWTENGTLVSNDSSFSFTAMTQRTLSANFTKKKYNATISVNPLGSGATTGSGTYDHGTLVKIEAKSNVGWRFVNWAEGETILSTDSSYSFVLLGNRNIIANFKKKVYSVSIVSKPNEGGNTTGIGSYEHGTSVSIVATPNLGWKFNNWTEGEQVTSADSAYTFTILGTRSFTANFSKKVYTISTSSSPNEGGVTSGDSTYTHGDNVTLRAIPNVIIGYEFVNWTENGNPVSTSSTYSFIATNNRTLVANFKLKTYTVTLSTNPAEGGTLGGAGTYTHGDSVSIVATPADGWLFANWTEEGVNISDSTTFTFRITGNRNIIANFAHELYSVLATPDPLGAGIISGAGTFYFGQTAKLIASSNPGWDFDNWTENGSVISSNPIYEFVVNGNRTIKANFSKTPFNIMCSSMPNEGGTTIGCGISFYGETMILNAIPNNGWKFINWSESDNIVSESSEYTFTVERDRNLVANFDLIDDIEQLDDFGQIPEKYYLSNAYPNPFNPETNIQFGLPEPSTVNLYIFNINGQLVTKVMDQVMIPAGNYKSRFNIERNGERIPSGVYFFRIIAQSNNSDNNYIKVGKLVLLK